MTMEQFCRIAESIIRERQYGDSINAPKLRQAELLFKELCKRGLTFDEDKAANDDD